MPALPIPACGFSVGFDPKKDTGIERVKALGGTMRGWTNYDAVKKEFHIVFEVCTFAEAATANAFHTANCLTGGITFVHPYTGDTHTCDYFGAEYDEKPGATSVRVEHWLREQ